MAYLRFLGLMGLLSLASCAAMKEQWVSQTCSRDSAYAQGVNDARSGKLMDSSYASFCPHESRAAVQAGYREGYGTGLDSLKGSVPQTVVSVNIGNSGGSGTSAPNAWFCELHAFTQRYEAFGPTQLEARRNVVHQCTARFHEMHCDDVTCRENH